MRYTSFNFTDSFSNASGSRRQNMALGELGKVINEHPLAVREAMRDAGVSISAKSNRRGIAKIIHKNRNNKSLIKNLSSLVMLNTKYDEEYSFLGKNKGGGTEKKGLFKKIGGFFKDRKARKAAEGGNSSKSGLGSRLGGLIRDNKDQIQDIGGSLLGGLLDRGASNTLQQQSVNPNNPTFNNNQNNPQKMTLGTKLGIGVGVLAVLGVVIYMARRKK